jgi:hypothetical protein
MAMELSTIELKHVKLLLADFTALAGAYEPYTQYFVATSATASRPEGGLEIWLSTHDGAYAYRTLNEVDVMTMMADNTSTVTDTYIKSTITEGIYKYSAPPDVTVGSSVAFSVYT